MQEIAATLLVFAALLVHASAQKSELCKVAMQRAVIPTNAIVNGL
jgi:hypothetical protein